MTVAVVLVVLVLHNLLTNLWFTDGWPYVPVNLATAAGLVAGAGAGVPVGTWWPGVVAAAAVLAAIALVGLLAPRVLADRRMAGVDARGTAWRALVRIPFGTVVLEEVAFRAVLPALLAPVAAAALFGLWHIAPTARTLDTNGVVAVVDLLRWPLGVPLVGWLNLALVWLFAHQLGVAWRDGAVARWSRRRFWMLAGVGLGGMLLLTGAFGYGRSMVGVGGRSNTFPPSLALVALGVWQFGLAMLVRPAVDRWLDRPRAWGAVVAANGMAMTVFLWHLTALVIAAGVALPGGLLPAPAVGTAAWWAWRPVWLLAPAVALVPLVWLFARVELRRVPAPAPGSVRAGVAALLVAAGLAVLARKGFAGPAMFTGGGLVVAGQAVLSNMRRRA